MMVCYKNTQMPGGPGRRATPNCRSLELSVAESPFGLSSSWQVAAQIKQSTAIGKDVLQPAAFQGLAWPDV